MKNWKVILLVICISISAYAQGVRSEVIDPQYAGKIFRNPAKTKNPPVGSPYTQTMFAPANVEKINVKAFMRYNAFNDEFEFISPKGDTLVLDKIEDFSDISFSGLNKHYKLVSYTTAKGKLYYSYLIDVYSKQNWGLLKKENILFIEAKEAKTTLETSMPAKYTHSPDTYFLKRNETTISEFPDGKKALLKLFPDKKQPIEAYLKEHKTDFDSEADLVKLVDFLSAL